MAELTDTLLNLVNDNESIDSQEVADTLNIDHQKIVGAIKSLQSLEEVKTAKNL